MTDLRLLVKARAFSVENLDVYGTAGIGRYHLAYSPDRMTVDPGGGLEPVTVAFDAVNDWSFALGAGVEHPVVRGLVAGAEITRSTFMLDTAHRSGSGIVTSREAFSSWNLRLSLSWRVRES
jgi:opacity protein-like surface antigen